VQVDAAALAAARARLDHAAADLGEWVTRLPDVLRQLREALEALDAVVDRDGRPTGRVLPLRRPCP